MSHTVTEVTVLDVRPIPKPERHPLIFDALGKLAVGESLVVQNDHNPIPLRKQVETLYGEQFSWKYLEEGPALFRLQFTRNAPKPVWVDLLDAADGGSASGPRWSHESEELDMTLLSWANGLRVEPHVNNEVDVTCIGVEGTGVVTINGEDHEMRPHSLMLIPKGSERGFRSVSERFSYVSVHRRRNGLRPTLGRGGRIL